jgi:protein-tyrosine phosphatase
MKVLVICTGNICRSPVAAAFLARSLAGADVSSAGLVAPGRRADPMSAAAAGVKGIDLADHRSRVIDRRLLTEDGADLVLTMERMHVREVVSLEPAAWYRAFTIREFVRRSDPAARQPTASDLSAYLSAISAGRTTAELLGEDRQDDVDDPFGLPASSHERMVAELDVLSGLVASRLKPFVP